MLTQEQLSILDLADRTGMIRVGDDKICRGITFAKRGRGSPFARVIHGGMIDFPPTTSQMSFGNSPTKEFDND